MEEEDERLQEPFFDIRRYAPPASSFTQAEHEEARRLGFADAGDRWVDRMKFRHWVDCQKSVAWRAKDLFHRDLESAGVSQRARDALGRAWRATTAEASGQAASEEDANIPGRLLEIQDRLEEMGVSLDMEDSEVGAGSREEFRAIKAELDSIAVRMRNADVDGALREAANTPRPNPGAPLPEMAEWVTPDPELRRIYEAYHAEAAYEAQQAQVRGFTTDGSPCVRELPDQSKSVLERLWSWWNDEAGEEDEWDEDSSSTCPDGESMDEGPV